MTCDSVMTGRARRLLSGSVHHQEGENETHVFFSPDAILKRKKTEHKAKNLYNLKKN